MAFVDLRGFGGEFDLDATAVAGCNEGIVGRGVRRHVGRDDDVRVCACDGCGLL